MTYCLVESGAVVSGPSALPSEFKNMTGFDKVADPASYGWYAFADPGDPAYDASTQAVSMSGFAIDDAAKTVTRTYAVTSLSADELAIRAAALIPRTITPLQGRLALLAAGKLAAVNAAVAAISDGGATAIWFEYATQWERSNPLLNQLGTALGMSGTDIDDLFRAAAKIV